MNNIYKNLLGVSLSLAAVFVLASCRGQESKEPPIHLNPNMDNQGKYKAYGENSFFADGRNMRPLVEGTVPRGHLEEDDAFYKGKVGDEYVKNPLVLTMEIMERGQERYDIYCSMCHGEAGSGEGIVIKRGFVRPPSYHDDRLRNMKDGEIFDIVSNGIRNMPGYRVQIPVEDRWAIVAYVRALQKSQNASMNDVPDNKKNF